MPAGDPGRTLAVSEQDGGALTGLLAELTIAVGSLRERLAAGREPPIPWEACHPVWQSGQVSLTSGAGTLNQADLFGPKDPYWWDLRTVTVWGFTAGTITAYLNDVNGEQIGQATTIGQFTWSGQVLLGPRDHVIFGATGVTGSVNVVARAIEVEAAWLPAYLM